MSHNLRILPLMALILGGLAGCAAPGSKSATSDAIRMEMEAATQGKAPPVKAAAVNNALLPPLEALLPQAENKPLEARFDLAVNNTPAGQVFMAIASGTHYNMLVPPEVSGSITLNLKDVTVFEALEAIRDLYGYEYKVDGNRIYIQPLALQTRLFQVNYLTAIRQGSSALSVQSTNLGAYGGGSGANKNGQGASGSGNTSSGTNSSGGGASSSTVTTVSDPRSDFWGELVASLRAIVGNEGGRSVIINSSSGVIVIRAMPDELKHVAAYLRASQISIERQVILEAKIIEVQLSDTFQSGVNWGAFKSGPNSNASVAQLMPNGYVMPSTLGTPNWLQGGNLSAFPGTLMSAGGAAGTMFGMAFQTSNFAALLSFLETQGNVHVLSSPRIATLNNQKAILKVGTDEYYITGFSSTPSTTNAAGVTTGGTVTATYAPMFSGIALDVTPNINEDNEIILHVHPSVTAIVEKNKFALVGSAGSSGVGVPMASTSVEETDSIVRARDGQIVVIGGLMRQASSDDSSGLPGLSKLLFGQTSKRTEKRELVILLKPTVVDGDRDWSDDIARSKERMNSMAAASRMQP